MNKLSVIILAAGKGKRMASETPKVLHPLAGIPILARVIRTAEALEPRKIFVVSGNGGDQVREQLKSFAVNWVTQEEQLGTAHAVLQALPYCDPDDRVLILYGDVPLISLATLQNLLEQTPELGLGLIVAEPKDPTGLGRIIRDHQGNIIKIVEHKDANNDELLIREINTGIMTAGAAQLMAWLPKIKKANRQQEFYLTDVVALSVAEGKNVTGVLAKEPEEVQGINDRFELATLERYFQRTAAKRWCLAGVTIADPNRFDVRGDDIMIGKDVYIDVNVVMTGKIRIANKTSIGANVVLKNVEIGEGVVIHPNTIIEDAIIEQDCQVGPFARIRPGTVLKSGAKVGNFVELKKTVLGKNSKAPHLTYLGDALIGESVNVGAGTITCNYDGANKWQTTIEDGAFIGSNTSLVAPVTIQKGATIGAGSTITADAPADQLTLTRAPQKSIEGWRRPTKKKIQHD